MALVLPEIFKTFHKVHGNSSRIYDNFFFCQAALLITKSLFGDAVKPSSPLGLLKRLKNLKNSNK